VSLTRINQNISAINAQRNLELNTGRISKSIERLSSGLRINRGADDPSGLVMSELLRAQVSGLDVAQQNSEQGVNVIKTAEGALNEVNALLRQMRDLAVNAASDSNNNDDSRAALQQQVSSGISTISQIANNTMYGSRNLLDGTAGTKTTIINKQDIGSASLTLGAEEAGYVEVTIDTAAEQAEVESNFTVAGAAITGAGQAVSAAINAINVGEWGAAETANLVINGVTIMAIDNTTTFTDVLTAVNTNTEVDVTAELTGTGGVDMELNFHSDAYGADEHISVEYDVGVDTINLEGIISGTADVKFGADNGVDMVGHAHFNGGAAVNFHDGSGLTLSNTTHGSIVIDAGANSAQTFTDALYVEEGELSFQIGVNQNQTAGMEIGDCRATALGTGVDATYTSLSLIDISTVEGASAALSVIDGAINEISTLRGNLGAFQVNELEAQTRSLAVARENLAASESSIRDTDFGREMAEFTTSQILVQSATSFLAQANALPQNVLTLVRG